MMGLDKGKFEKSGGYGCSNSDYELQATTCCGRPVVWDVELDDIYFDPADLTYAVRIWEQKNCPCPLCGALKWDVEEWDSTKCIPPEWAWAEQK